jgi:hypothetical protein
MAKRHCGRREVIFGEAVGGSFPQCGRQSTMSALGAIATTVHRLGSMVAIPVLPGNTGPHRLRLSPSRRRCRAGSLTCPTLGNTETGHAPAQFSGTPGTECGQRRWTYGPLRVTHTGAGAGDAAVSATFERIHNATVAPSTPRSA